MNRCRGSDQYASTITDDGLAHTTQAGPPSRALNAPSTALVLRYPRGVCPVCHGQGTTNTKGLIQVHTDRTGTP